MTKFPLAVGLATAVAAVSVGALAAQALQRQDQAVLARWSELRAAEQAQFAAMPAVLALTDTPPALDARARCQALAPFDSGPPLIDDAQRFDRYKQARADCTGGLFRLLAALRSDPALAGDAQVQALGQALTRGQVPVDAARDRYRQALAGYQQDVHRLPGGIAAALLGYPERPDFVRVADGNP